MRSFMVIPRCMPPCWGSITRAMAVEGLNTPFSRCQLRDWAMTLGPIYHRQMRAGLLAVSDFASNFRLVTPRLAPLTRELSLAVPVLGDSG